jgi:dienelactone hydrolase
VAGHPDLHYAAELARRGYVTLAPDAPYFGTRATDPYALGWASASLKATWDHTRAIDLLARHPRVDARRIGVLGHSMGGAGALMLAAFDTRVGAVVSSCGFTSFHRYAGGDLSGYAAPACMPWVASRFGNDPARMPFDFDDVLSAIAPRPVLVIAATHDGIFAVEGVREVVGRAAAAYDSLGARGALSALYVEAYHHFPSVARDSAYAWLDMRLRGRK